MCVHRPWGFWTAFWRTQAHVIWGVANLGGFMASLKNRNLPFIWDKIKNRPWRIVRLGWVQLEAESCFWDGDKRDNFKKGNSQRFCSISTILRNDWEQMGWMRGFKSDSLSFQLLSTSDLQSKKCHHVSAGSLGQKSYCSVIHRCFGSSFSVPAQAITSPVHLKYIWSQFVRNTVL